MDTPSPEEDEKKISKPDYLSGRYKNSFAYPTLKDRVPIIICKVIDLLHRHRRQLEPEQDQNSLKNCIEKMAQLRYELQTNKPLTPITDGREDEKVWNDYLESETVQEGEIPKWFNTRWLYAECYAYRRLLQCMSASTLLADFDIFQSQKEEAFFGSLSAIRVLAQSLHELLTEAEEDEQKLRHNFLALLEVSLWGNKCDLSISAGSAQSFADKPLEQILLLRNRLLVDDSESVWDFLSEQKSSEAKIVDLIMDNAGFELFADLCLADFLVTFGLAKKVRLRVKNVPWFVSDTTPRDIDWLLSKLIDGAENPLSGDGKCDVMRSGESDRRIGALGRRWREFLDSKLWSIHPDSFWTYPHDFSLMRSADPELYSTLSESSLILFKGDLNYRKLVGDLNWNSTATFQEALQGFHPAPLVALRTLKADVVTGLAVDQAEKISKQDPNWMVNGEWGLIQFCSKKA